MWSQVTEMSPQNVFFSNSLPPSRECHKYASCVMAFEGAEDVASCRFAKSFLLQEKNKIDMTVNLSDAPMASMVMARPPVCLESPNQTK